ncbi:cadherin-like domain-containing protein [Acuticoccus sediminis]|uniref:cadherin-like domain-containing protein n=1 Tax=Acuticoccus sediminis TaxID=2184697 RepID=UPI001CFE9BA4|nr:cadherin-like domain-containing protein [Acuticoccus sediminis]
MTLANALSRTAFNGYSAADEATVRAAFTQVYGTAAGKAMIDGFLTAPANSITFNFAANDAAANLNTGDVFYDPAFSTGFMYLNKSGVAIQEIAAGTIAHELVHALTGRDDEPSWFGQNDFAGDTVTFANTIFTQLGIDPQLSYPGSNFASVLELGRDYAMGAGIDRAWSKDGDFPEPTITAPDARDLIIGGASANTLNGGGGNDILVGNNGNDILIGGGGIDVAVYDGNQLDYDVRQNADSSWTVRHVRGAADEGTDTLIDVERIRFDSGATFELKKGALTFQTDFGLVIDTTGSMGSSIGAVKNQATALINAAFKGGMQDARIGVVGFKDNTIGEPTSIIQSFTDQDVFADRQAAALAAINGISVGGGGDLPETAFDGLLNALNGAMGDWRTGASVKRVALFTDAAAKDGALAGAVAALASNIGATISGRTEAVGAKGALSEYVFEFASDRFDPTSPDGGGAIPDATPDTTKTTVQIFTIFTGTPDFTDTTDLEKVASENGGEFFTADSDSDLVDILFEVIELPPNAIPLVSGPVELDSIEENSGPISLTAADFLAGATDADGDVLTVDGLTVSEGTLVELSPTTWTYEPDPDATGVVTFTYNITDGEASVSQSATLEVTPTNELPVAEDDTGPTLAAGEAVTILAADLLANDTDGDGDTLTILSVGGAVGGTVALNAAGNVVFTADDDFVGDASFTYRADDGSGDTGPTTIATVALVVEPASGATEGPDLIMGTPASDDLAGLGGDDTISGLGRGDLIDGGPGDDLIRGGDGNDTVTGNTGNDTVVGNNGADVLNGGRGNDVVGGQAGNDELDGGGGSDTVLGGAGDDTMTGGDKADEVRGDSGDDLARGGAGHDTVFGNGGNDTVIGNDGNDLLDGGRDDDLVAGQDGNDTMFGGTGRDSLLGGDGNDRLDGEEHADELFGQDGNDVLFGGDGKDMLNGGDGDDTIFGGNGKDVAIGGDGADTFALEVGPGALLIEDFTQGEDLLGLTDGLAFEDLAFTGNTIRVGDNDVLARFTDGFVTSSLDHSDFVALV